MQVVTDLVEFFIKYEFWVLRPTSFGNVILEPRFNVWKIFTVICMMIIKQTNEKVINANVFIWIKWYTGRFIMFSVITNIYNKKNKGPTLMELFTATGKHFLFTPRVVRCVHHGWHGTHRYDMQVLATHASASSCRCVPCHPWCTHRTTLVVKKNQFSCGCEQFH